MHVQSIMCNNSLPMLQLPCHNISQPSAQLNAQCMCVHYLIELFSITQMIVDGLIGSSKYLKGISRYMAMIWSLHYTLHEGQL
jgi:hypothetical protein